MIKDVVVKREFAAGEAIEFGRTSDKTIDVPWDKVDALGLDRGPAGLFDIGSSLGELGSGDLACPVGLDGLFDFTVGT